MATENVAGQFRGSSTRHAAGNVRRLKLAPAQDKKLRESAANFEAMFIKQMLGAMRKTVTPIQGDDPLIKKGQGEKMFEGMLDDEYAKMASQRQTGGMGLKEAIYDQLTRAPGVRPGGSVMRVIPGSYRNAAAKRDE
ncbi:putative chemotactic signal-response protein [Magnetofaba australis IT-1]|uniref:Putative chemotactic signal-response protein n=1 Tax=Magnetofaba australis IT-1 TaxID=1434232 RepID=A0A1Y2K412_9PROT|nr:putative chemotactic signal-response protein [Magnetofaba australis IT-1]